MIAGATTEVAFQAKPDVLFGRVRILVEQARGGHDHAGCAVAALQAMVLHEGLLHRVQRAVGVGHAFDGLDLLAIGLHRKDGAALHSLTIEMDGAGAAR